MYQNVVWQSTFCCYIRVHFYVFSHFYELMKINHSFISELIEENEENEELSEVDRKNHFRPGKKLFSKLRKFQGKEKPRHLSPALSVERDCHKNSLGVHMRGSTLERNLISVHTVTRDSVSQEALKHMR